MRQRGKDCQIAEFHANSSRGWNQYCEGKVETETRSVGYKDRPFCDDLLRVGYLRPCGRP